MPRDSRVTGAGESWRGEVWASSTQAEADVDARTGEATLVFEDGYEETYSQNAGAKPTRRQTNWMYRLLTALTKEINEGGAMLEWDSSIDYTAAAHVVGTDGHAYRAVQASTNQDPVADTSNTHWRRLVPDAAAVPEANTTRHGTVRYATTAEAGAGTRTDRVGSLANITSMINAAVSGRLLPTTDGSAGQFLGHDGTYRDLPAGTGPATTAALGTVRYATAAQVGAGTATDRVGSIANITSMISAAVSGRLLPTTDGSVGEFLAHDGVYRTPPPPVLPLSTEVSTGVVRRATQAEAQGGTDNTAVLTSARASQLVDARIPPNQRLPATGAAGQFLRHDGTYGVLPTATATAAGLTEYATTAEVESSSAVRSMTPSVLPIKKVVTYTATQDVTAANVAGTLHLKAEA